jgi:hypothetical protein
MCGTYSSKIHPCNSLKLGTIDVSSINKEASQKNNNIIFYDLKKDINENDAIYHGFRLFTAPKKFMLNDPELFYSIKLLEKDKDKLSKCEMEIKSKNIALYVFIESDNIDFIASDNFFSMKPNETRNIILKEIRFLNNKGNLVKKNIQKEIYVKSLYDLMKK